MNKDVRWKERFQNFEKAFKDLEATIKLKNPSKAERAGLIQFFEMTFELSWKTIKDYLEAQGYQVNGPREALKQAFQIHLLEEGHLWMKALEDRNLTTHTYDEAISQKIESLIRDKYYLILKNLYLSLKKKAQ
ncbi:MAG: nucleotidyltransferase [Deltaproteobacteria bacterium RIFCSPHIGHO2_02_FULL_40_11]|nr:MAG: nucleotidyltransferase [Deltaproteobacteria bacterium RIFCSPHIGHO2_02_FULL_40_11]